MKTPPTQQILDLLCRALVKLDQMAEEIQRLKVEVIELQERAPRLRIRLKDCRRAKP